MGGGGFSPYIGQIHFVSDINMQLNFNLKIQNLSKGSTACSRV